jgi:pimeloyl-ACP methyl ester carboxylesterase
MKLHYRELGNGQPLVILHGLFGFSDNWQTHAKKLAEYYRVILIDLRNHGHSKWSDEFSYSIMVEDVKELYDSLELKKSILIGHSMGGKTAMRFTQLHENLVEKLIVVDMGVKSYPMHHNQILEGLYAVQLSPGLTRGDAEEQMKPNIESVGVRQFLLKNLYWKEKGQLAWRMNLEVLHREMPKILEALPETENMTQSLFIRGELSNYILSEDIPKIETFFPDSTFVSIPNAGHWVHAEQPEQFIQSVLEFCLR